MSGYTHSERSVEQFDNNSSDDETLRTSVADHVEAGDIIEDVVGTDSHGQQMVAGGRTRRNAKWDMTVNRESDWAKDPKVEHSGDHGESLETQERREAREDELAHQRDRAMDAQAAGRSETRVEDTRDTARAVTTQRGKVGSTDASTHEEIRTVNGGSNRLRPKIEAAVPANERGIARQSGDHTQASVEDVEDATEALEESDEPVAMGEHDEAFDRTGGETVKSVADSHSAPWGDLSQDEVAIANRAGAKVADALNRPTVRTVAAKAVCRRIANGESPTNAVDGLIAEMERQVGAEQDIADLHSLKQHRATVTVTVTKLWDPNDRSQRQVGLVTDGTADSAKLTIWEKTSAVPRLREGDTIRLDGGIVGWHKGQKQLAVDSNATVTIHERGSGEVRENTLAAEEKEAGQLVSQSKPSWSAESDTHAWANGRDMDKCGVVTRWEMARRNNL